MIGETVGRARERARADRALHDRSGVVVHGPVGVGKSHLVDLVVADLAAEPVPPPLARLWARDVAGCEVDAAVAGLLGATPTTTVPAEETPVLVVEDLDVLDGDLTRRLGLHLRHGHLRVIGTIRTPSSDHEAWTVLWKDGVLDRLDLEPFTLFETDALLGTLLDGLVSVDLAWWAWEATKGSPRAVLELVGEAREQGTIICKDGVWLPAGTPRPGAGMQSLVETRLASSDPSARRALELVALGAPLPLHTLVDLTSPSALDAATATGLITWSEPVDGTAVSARLTPPLVADIVRSLVPQGRRRALFDVVIDSPTIDEDLTRPSGRSLLVQVASWSVEVGRPLAPPMLLAALRAAEVLGRLIEVPHLARAVADSDPDAHIRLEARLILGRSLRFLGSFHESSAAIDSCAAEVAGLDLADDIEAGLGLAVLHAGADFTQYVEDRPDEAIASIDRFASSPGIVDREEADPVRVALRADRAMRRVYAGDRTGLDEARRLLDAPGVPDALRLELATVIQVAAALSDPTETVIAAIEDSVAKARVRTGNAPWALQANLSALFVALLWRGEPERASELMEDFEAELGGAAFVDLALWQFGRGMVANALGRRELALTELRAAVARLERLDYSGWLAFARSGLALAQAAHGDVADALATLARARSTPLRTSRLVIPHIQALWSRVEIAAGVRGGAATAVELAESARAEGLHLAECWGLHALGLAGVADRVADFDERVDFLDEQLRSPLPRALLTHVRAVRAAGGDTGEAVADAARQVARLGYWSPIHPSTTGALTKRQREVAQLAATGLSSREIADRLFISRRTVEAHLDHAFAALGVHSRAELALLFASPRPT